MNKFNAASYQRKVTNHKNRRATVIKSLSSYIEDVVKESGTVTFSEPIKFKMSHDDVVALHWGQCPKPYLAGEFYNEGVVLELSIPKASRGFVPGATPLSKTRMTELIEVAEAVEAVTHSPAPLVELRKEVEALNSIYLKETSEMIEWINRTVNEKKEIRFKEPVEISVLADTPIVAIRLAVAKVQGSKEKTEQVCLLVQSENKLIGQFEKKVPLTSCRKNLDGILTLAKEIDKALAEQE